MAVTDLGRRALGAARLDPSVYEEVERDGRATGQAFLIVILSGVAAAIGAVPTLRPAALVAGAVVAVLGWLLWAVLCLWIGGRLAPEPRTRADRGELLRVLGFAAAPGIVQVLGIVAPFRTPVLTLAQVWMILAMVVAVRQALDYESTLRAAGVCLAAWAVQLVAVLAVLSLAHLLLDRRAPEARRPADAVPTAGYVGVVKPSGVAPPVE